MSSVSGISNSYASSYSDISATNRRQRPDPAKMAEDLFSQLDTSGKGYIQASDLESALSTLQSSSSTQSASEIFSQLDSDSDGKVTKDELSTSIKKMAEELDSQFNQMRMQGGMPPPPPSSAEGSDSGFTKDELTSQLSEIGSSDSARSSLITKVVENFDKADTNSDGKVSFQEAMAYDQSTATSSSTDSSTTSSDSTTTTAKTDAQVFRQLMELLRTYGNDGQSDQSTLSTLLSISA